MLVAVAQFAQAVRAHKAAFINIAAHTHDASFAGVLPEANVAVIGQHGLLVGVHGYHELIVVELALQVLVVEVAPRIDKGLLMVGLLHKMQELVERVAELLGREARRGLYVEHRYKVLLAGQALGLEVGQLQAQVGLGPEEVVGAHLQAMAMGQVDVALVAGVYAVAALGGLQVDVGHLGVVANGLPEHLALIVAHVNAMNVLTGVFALQVGILVNGGGDARRGGLLLRGLLLGHHAGGAGLGLAAVAAGLGAGRGGGCQCYEQGDYNGKSFHRCLFVCDFLKFSCKGRKFPANCGTMRR